MEDTELVMFSENSAASSIRDVRNMPERWSDESIEESLAEGSDVEISEEPDLEPDAMLSSSPMVDFLNGSGEQSEEEDIQNEKVEMESATMCENEDVSDSDSIRFSDINPIIKRKKFTHADRVRTLHLRRNLNQLDAIFKEKEMTIQKLREELNACRQRIEHLECQRGTVDQEIEMEKEADNIAAVFRLRATHRRLCTELGNEESLEWKIKAMLQDHEAELWQIEIEQGKFDNLREKLQQEEAALEQQRTEEADRRLQKKETADQQVKRRQQASIKKERQIVQEREARHRKAVEEAQRNHEKAVQFLKETMTRVRQKDANEELKTRGEMEKRMQAVLTLKNNISSNRDNIRVIQARKKVREKEAKKQEEQAKEAVLAEGGDVTKFLIHQKRLAEFEKQKQEFEEQQQSRKIEILSKILREEEYLEKKKKHQLPTESLRKSGDKGRSPSKRRAKAVVYMEKTCGEQSPVVEESKKWRTPSPLSDLDSDEDKQSEETLQRAFGEKAEEEEGELLAQPEFLGLWDQEHKPYKVIKDESDAKPLGGSKAEKDMLAETLEKLRSGIVRKQVASGHEFKGCPFYSKPDIINFKDFDVGRTYKKKIIMTNASYSINFCKLVGVSEHLKDFIAIQFEPPGQLCPGMSCEMAVTFKPMINEDLEGKVMLLAQTGSFSIPITCTTKKCELAVDKELIDFGTYVVGETISRTITLTNRGALGTAFKFQTLTNAGALSQLASTKSSQRATPSQESVGLHLEGNGSAIHLDPSQGKPGLSEHPSVGKGNMQGRPQPNLEICGNEELEDLASGIAKNKMESVLEEPVEIRIGEISQGDVAPFGSVKLYLIFTPIIPGKVVTDFEITFTNPTCKPILIKAIAVSLSVPVWVSNPEIDLKICMYDRLYQDSIVIQSRASTALSLKLDVCQELKHHMELLPRFGFIQAHSSFSVQLKFLPRPSIADEAGTYFDKETGVLELPMVISVADQIKPVLFTVHAVVTTSDLEISPAEVDFGFCTIYEAVQTTVKITNKSILPQEFGFVGVPECAEIQPNDGFGTLLPMETMDIDIIFKALKAKDYSFDLICKSAINRQFKVSCRAVGVRPPLELSHSLVRFAATSLNDVSTATLFVINSHTSKNEFTHDVARIGKGSIAPVGPTSFEFRVPEDAPITISPCVGTVLPGKKCLVQVAFQPTLEDQAIREEAVRILCRAAEARAALEKAAALEAEIAAKEKKEKASAKKGSKKSQGNPSPKEKVSEHPLQASLSVPFQAPMPEEIKMDSDEYAAALASLLRSFSGKFESVIVPCFVASHGELGDPKNPGPLTYSPYNTLYLELQCPVVAPALAVTSDSGKHNINFGEVATGQRVLKKVTVQNICYERLDLSFSILNTNGPFQLLNPPGPVDPGSSYVLLIAFSPDDNKKFFEHLDVYSSKGTLPLSVTGQGLTPSISCSVEGGLMDMGYVLANESTTATFQLDNTSTFTMKYLIKLSSLSEKRQKDKQKLPPFIIPYQGTTDLVGTQNYSGLSVFSVSPIEGTIDPEKSQELTVTFSPDHESLYYSDCLRVELVSKEVMHMIRLKGASRNHIMYLEGGDPIDVSVESLSTLPADEGEHEETVHPLVLNLQCIQTEDELKPAVRELYVGCIKTNQQAGKKQAVEFSLDGISTLQQKGFTIDLAKGSVEAGQRKPINISWTPRAGHDEQKVVAAETDQKISGIQKEPNRPLTATAELTLKGDITETYRILITAMVVSA
ncbi:cilia- and flagella-associated protein 74 isoform X2 [Ambystoma mexicanum]|uniref:cilia- and flagella-associated protein 74 isoform X2 n=1 Tax=Ambystoma mexicanum TaxID=8296 RepID=UPI0037E8B7CC